LARLACKYKKVGPYQAKQTTLDSGDLFPGSHKESYKDTNKLCLVWRQPVAKNQALMMLAAVVAVVGLSTPAAFVAGRTDSACKDECLLP